MLLIGLVVGGLVVGAVVGGLVVGQVGAGGLVVGQVGGLEVQDQQEYGCPRMFVVLATHLLPS